MEHSLLHSETVQPFAFLGFQGILFEFDSETILHTWIALGILLLGAVVGRRLLNAPQTSLVRYTLLSLVKSFKTLVEQSTHHFVDRYFFFVTSLFIFIFTCSAIVVLPGLEEPTKNLNTTFALALISFFYVQKEMFFSHGPLGYFQEYFKTPFRLTPLNWRSPLAVIMFIIKGVLNVGAAILVFPLEALSKMANVLSLSLRLFGNIFGSSIMITMFKQATTGTRLIGLVTTLTNLNIFAGMILAPIIIMLVATVSLVLSFGFGIIESLIQAFVFSILTLTYITLATQHSHDATEEKIL